MLKFVTAGRPLCKDCNIPMWLVSIEPEREGHDARTFECPRCQEAIVEVIKYNADAA
jgi:hypothetical protein